MNYLLSEAAFLRPPWHLKGENVSSVLNGVCVYAYLVPAQLSTRCSHTHTFSGNISGAAVDSRSFRFPSIHVYIHLGS